MLNILIILLASGSYYIGVKSVLMGKYKPSIYSRALWFFLTVNSFFGVITLHNSLETITLASIQLLGCLAMLFVSYKYSIKKFGKIEIICSVLLIMSIMVWLLEKSPFMNLTISLIAFFIGGIPSIIQAWKKPQSENFLFWFLFASASCLSFLMADKTDPKAFTYSLYYFLFDSLLSFLSFRQFIPIQQTKD